MKKTLLGLLSLVLFAGTSLTGHSLTDNEKYLLNKKMGAVASKVSLGDKLDVHDVARDLGTDGAGKQLLVARATYDVTGVDDGAVGAHGLGVNLPAGAILVQSWFYVETQFVDGGSGTVALHCEDANNIYSAADITGNSAGAIVAGAQTGTAGNMTAAIAAQCEITATVATAEQTAGKLILFVEYVLHD